jgi:predicted transcriptional regulator
MRIEQAAPEQEHNSMTTEGDTLDLAPEAEALQVEEIRRRLASRTGRTIPNEQVMAWLDTWGQDKEIPPPESK